MCIPVTQALPERFCAEVSYDTQQCSLQLQRAAMLSRRTLAWAISGHAVSKLISTATKTFVLARYRAILEHILPQRAIKANDEILNCQYNY